MKVLALLFALTLAGKMQHSHSQEDKAKLGEKFDTVFRLPKLSNVVDELTKEAIRGFYIDKTFTEETWDPLEANMTACMAEAGKEMTCSLLKKMDECSNAEAETLQKKIPENKKYLVKLYFERYWKSLEYACNAKDEEISELSADCIVKKSPFQYFNHKYYENDIMEPAKTFLATPTMANMCKVLRASAPVFTDTIRATCENDATVKAYNGYIEASLKHYCD